jgi:pyridoxal phosphate enzyme (YggS family)
MSIDLIRAKVKNESSGPVSEREPASTDVKRNLEAVRKSIAAAARGAARDPNSVRLVAVTKTFPSEKVMAAYNAGAREIGENRIEEAREKIANVSASTAASDPVHWHLIGHLQRRKAREAVELFSLIQSVDSVKLARTLDRHARALGKRQSILLQVNVARDPHKFGFSFEPRDVFFQAVGEILGLSALRVQGLMTIGPLTSEPEQARPFFRALRDLRDDLAKRFPDADWHELSMGMTDDFSVAIAEGATIVRIGRAIFGERK